MEKIKNLCVIVTCMIFGCTPNVQENGQNNDATHPDTTIGENMTGGNHETATLTLAAVRSCRFDDIASEPIWQFFVRLSSELAGNHGGLNDLATLKTLGPELRDLCAIMRFFLLAGSGGVSEAIVGDQPKDDRDVFTITRTAFKNFDADPIVEYLDSLAPIAEEHWSSLDAMNEAITQGLSGDEIGALERRLDEIEQKWEPVESLWEDLFYEHSPDVSNIVNKNPAEFTYPRSE
ncbi:MAG: hypothetical protein AAF497_26750 [Planctomycetota bacterium]